MAQMSEQIIKLSQFDFILGMQDNVPAYKINPRALAYALNMRIDDEELQTALGRSKVNSTAMAATDIKGLAAGQRVDGTEDVMVAVSGGYWKLDGNTKTLVSKYNTSAACSVETSGSDGVMSADATTFYGVVSGVDVLILNGQMASPYMQTIKEISPDYTKLYLDSGLSLSGASFNIWKKAADVKTRIRMYNNRWYFGNKTDKFTEWDPTMNASGAYRDVGMPSAAASTVEMSGGGGMLSGSAFIYKYVWEDGRNRYGNASVSAAVLISGANLGVSHTLNKTYPYWAEYTRIYRSAAIDGISAISAISASDHTLYYRGRVAVSASYWLDNLSGGLSLDEQPPIYNYQPTSGCDDFIFFRDRLVVQRGSTVSIGGVPIWNTPHSGDPPGLVQPEYDPGRQQYLGKDSGQQKDGRGLFILREKLYALQSDSLWRLDDSSFDADAWRFRQIAYFGCESQWTVDVDGDRAFWVGKQNGRLTVFMFDAIEEQVQPIGRALRTTIKTITKPGALVGGCGMGFYRVSLSGSSAVEMEYNVDSGRGRGAWCLRDWKHSAYAAGTVSAYGADRTGFVYQLENTLGNASSAQSYEVHFAELSDPPELQGGSISEYPKHWGPWQLEVYGISGIGSIGLSGFYSVDGSAEGLISGSTSISAANATVKIHRCALPNEAYGRRCQIRLKSFGTGKKFRIRGFTLKAQVEIGNEEINSEQGRL